MLSEFAVCGIGTLITLILFYDKPPTSPSMSQKLKRNANNIPLTDEFCQMIKNINFIYLFIGFGIGLGIFNGIITLINQYTAAYGYDTDDAGM